MRKPITIMFNDVHLKQGNEIDTMIAYEYMLEKATELDIDKIIFGGDLFDSRSNQRQSVLNLFDDMLDKALARGIHIYAIPGNHDKSLYNSTYSFMYPYRHHPALTLYSEPGVTLIGGIDFTFVPFMDDEHLVKMLGDAPSSDILISHFEMNGSNHLGHISEKKSITKNTLKKWKKTYLGHFHNEQNITKDITHLPSFRQTNFGENSNKGFTIIYNDLSYEVVKGRFKEFSKIVIDADTVSQAELARLTDIHKNSEQVVRFEFIGSETALKSIDKNIFKNTSIDTKFKYEKVLDAVEVIMPTVDEVYDEHSIINNFNEFCEEKGYDYNSGLVLLKEFLNNKDV